MLQAILFDLDGTLLPMDNDYFVKVYFGYLAECASAWGYEDKDKLIDAIWKGLEAMVRNDGSRSNSEAFWGYFTGVYGEKAYQDIQHFEYFYGHDFNRAASVAAPAPLAADVVRTARRKAGHVILATNPVFPAIADEMRLSWIGLKMEDFDLVTDYDNCRFSKPNPAFYQDVLERFHLDADRCLMVGNDVDEDILAAQKTGMKTWLLDDFLINRKGREITCPRGSYEQLLRYLEELPEER